MKTVTPITDDRLTASAMGFLSPRETDLGGNKVAVLWPFVRTVTITKAQAAAGKPVLRESEVPKGSAVFVTHWKLDVSGATAWTDATATKVGLYDTSAVPTVVVEVAKAGLTANATLFPQSANTTLGSVFRQEAGCPVGRGLVFKSDALFANGSDMTLTVYGYCRSTMTK